MRERKSPMLKPTILAAIVCGLALPRFASAQAELEVRRVSTDYRADQSFLMRSDEPVPDGWGIAARYIATRHVFFELEYSGGAEDKYGAICGGFLENAAVQCVPETVRYFGSVLAFTAGWPGRIALGSRWSAGVRPKVGLGALHASEQGHETGREHSETRLSLNAGAALELTHHIPRIGLGLGACIEASRVRPVRIGSCEDCIEVLRADVTRVAYGVAVTWRPPAGR